MKKTFLLLTLLFATLSNAQLSDFKNVNFTKADNIAHLNANENLQSLPILSYKLTTKLSTDVEKFRAIYTWVCTNIKGDYKQHNTVSRKRNKFKYDSISLAEWNSEYKKKAFKKLLKHQKTMCTGYAYLIKELSILAGIECQIIDGFGRSVTSNIDTLETANHSWNAVKLNNKWYLCDATWSSGYMDGENTFISDYNSEYFLADPILFAKNHYPIDTKWLLNNEITSVNFLNAPLIYCEAFKYMVFPISTAKMNITVTKKTPVKFSFRSDTTIDLSKFSLVFYTGSFENKFPIETIMFLNGIITITTKFNWKGCYDVHLKIENDVVATYVIKVNDM